VNLLVDFTLHRWEGEGPQQGQESLWAFRFGKCQDFQQAIAALKTIPQDQRHYYREKHHLWEVVPNPRNHQVLARTFDNFESCLATARSQMRLL
jgi:hypothetical protein